MILSIKLDDTNDESIQCIEDYPQEMSHHGGGEMPKARSNATKNQLPGLVKSQKTKRKIHHAMKMDQSTN